MRYRCRIQVSQFRGSLVHFSSIDTCTPADRQIGRKYMLGTVWSAENSYAFSEVYAAQESLWVSWVQSEVKGTEVTMSLNVAVWLTWRLKTCSSDCGQNPRSLLSLSYGALSGVSPSIARMMVSPSYGLLRCRRRTDEKCDITVPEVVIMLP